MDRASLKMVIEAVLFDIYGTLLFVSEESVMVRSRMIANFLKAHGIDTDPEDVALKAAHRWIEFSRGYFADVYAYFRAILQDIADRDHYDDRFMDELIEVGALDSEAELAPDVTKTLDELSELGIKCGIVSNSPCYYAIRDLGSAGILDYFDVLGISSRWKITKPDPEIFLRTASALNVKPQHVLAVGNDPLEDVKGAKLADMKSALLNKSLKGMWSTSRAVFGECMDEIECEPDYIIEEIGEILTIIYDEQHQDI